MKAGEGQILEIQVYFEDGGSMDLWKLVNYNIIRRHIPEGLESSPPWKP
jgi:hypothetical protein